MFELCELEGNQRAGRDPEWAALLARVRVGQSTEADVKTLEGLVVKRGGKRQPANGAVHLFATRQQVANRNNSYIEELAEHRHVEIRECPAGDISVVNGTPLPPEKAWLQSEDTGGLETMLRLAEGAEVMLRKNLDVQDGLVNGARGKVQHIDLHDNGEVDKIWVMFEKGAGSKWQQANQSTGGVAIRRTTASYQDKDGNKAERRQFPLVLAKACTIHKSQAATYHAGVHARLDKHCKQAGQAYVALSRSPSMELCTLEAFDRASLQFNRLADWALATLKLKQAKSSGPKKEAQHSLWQEIIFPAETASFYELKLGSMEPPNWKQYVDEQRAKDAPKEDGGEAGTLTCPRCGWVADSPYAYKKHKCPAKAKSKAKAAPTAKGKAESKAKAAPTAKGKAKSKAKAGSKPAPKPKASTGHPSNTAAPTGPGSTAFPDSPPPLPPPANPPSPSLPPPAPCFFFQQQQAAHCGMHALNNAAGSAVYTPADMEAAAANYMREMAGVDHAVEEHIGPGGWYSVQVLYAALFAQGWALDMDNRVLNQQQAHGASAFIQNWRNRHWVAYRWGPDGRIYLLDSMQCGPKQITEEEFCASLLLHPTYAVRAPSDLPAPM